MATGTQLGIRSEGARERKRELSSIIICQRKCFSFQGRLLSFKT